MSGSGPDIGSPGGGTSSRGWRFWLIVAAVVIGAIFIAQNSQQTTVKFLFAETEMPLFFALIAMTLIGALLGWLVPKLRDRR